MMSVNPVFLVKKTSIFLLGFFILHSFLPPQVLYVRHFYSNGDFCHDVHKPREVVVKLHCMKSSKSHAVTIYLREPSTCSYILGVSIMSVICLYAPQVKSVFKSILDSYFQGEITQKEKLQTFGNVSV